MGSRRTEQVGEAIRTEISEMISHELRDPRLGFVTITEVEVSLDLRHAKVFVSVFGSEEEQKASLMALQHASGFVRRHLSQRLSLRQVPEINFRLDRSMERADRIMRLLREVEATTQEPAEPESGGQGQASPPDDQGSR